MTHRLSFLLKIVCFLMGLILFGQVVKASGNIQEPEKASLTTANRTGILQIPEQSTSNQIGANINISESVTVAGARSGSAMDIIPSNASDGSIGHHGTHNASTLLPKESQSPLKKNQERNNTYPRSFFSYSQSGAMRRFEEKFNSHCSKYPFVRQYTANLETPSPRYIIFLFHENGQRHNGGLGDRLAGMVTAIAYALRTNRTLLIEGDKAFEEAFQAYHPHPHARRGWGNWDWSGWKREYAIGGNFTNLKSCVNPKPASKICQLDGDLPQSAVKYRSNRAFLCRWSINPYTCERSDLNRLGITPESDLFEVAGCLLRLAMWPTERMWQALDETVGSQLRHMVGVDKDSGSDRASDTVPVSATAATTATTVSSAPTGTESSRPTQETVSAISPSLLVSYQIGFHFRCGDKSFLEPGTHNPECYFNESVEWKGTSFMDDKSWDSPVDIGLCGNKTLHELHPEIRKNALAYIASDYPQASQQINSTLHWPKVVVPTGACHIDIHKNADCSFKTLVDWFTLAISDTIVMQELYRKKDKEVPAFNLSSWNPSGNNTIKAPRSTSLRGGISAFSRFASMYALGPDVTRYGRHCDSIDQGALSRVHEGNWMCDHRQLY